METDKSLGKIIVLSLLFATDPVVSGKADLTISLDKKAEKYVINFCQQKVISDATVNYQSCLNQKKKEINPLIQLYKKYVPGFIGGWCGTKEVRQALGIETVPFTLRPSFKDEDTSWREIRKIDGWIVYALHDAWSKPVPGVLLVAVKKNTIQIKESMSADNGFGKGVYCLGYTGKSTNSDWFGFPVTVYHFDAIYP